MTYIDVYNELKKTSQASLDRRRKSYIRVVLGYSVCSVSVGANEVLKALEKTVESVELDNVIIETTGCLGLCSNEPLLNIYMPDGNKYTYDFVTPEKAKVILISHSMHEEVIDEWLIKM